MKKQINPTIKAHLIRSAFYVLLLLAVCVIPFALAQQSTKRSAIPPTLTQSQSQLLPYDVQSEKVQSATTEGPPLHRSRLRLAARRS